MNKNDIRMLIIVVIVIILLFGINMFKKPSSYALVYHGSDVILNIDLNIDREYVVNGDNGEVVIVVKDHKIKVTNENSPYHLCSKQGYISKKGESIICLPNRIVIELPLDDIDVEVK